MPVRVDPSIPVTLPVRVPLAVPVLMLPPTPCSRVRLALVELEV